MKERELRDLIADVKTGRMTRRSFVQRMIAVGLTAPMAGMMLAQSGVPMQAAEIPYKPTKAGGGGLLKILYWQAVTLLNPHFAVGTKDQDGSRIFYEPLAGWDAEGNLVPVLAAERAPVSRVHQAQIQAELARVLVLAGGIDSSTEFQGSSVSTDSKRYTDGDGGVPPRGRPV